MRNATSYGGNGVMWRGISSGRQVRGNYVLKASTAHNQAELERYVHNPQVRAFLDFIAASEGVKHGYQTAIGNYRITDFSRHPGNSVRRSFTRTDGSRST
ncbi:hypothetical protein AB7D65_002198, partial [Neisseria gonorrhoeae]